MRFECDTGYEVIGASQVLCLSTSNWDPSTVPICEIKKCPETPHIPNGNTRVEVDIDGSVDVYGAVLKVECNANYIVNGPVRIQCDENGQWTQTPTCSQVNCPPYEGIDGKCVRKVDLDGMYFFLYCTDNATFVHGGAEMAICTNGNWDDPTMRCYCDCAINADTGLVKIDNLNANGILRHDQPLVWRCKNGARKASSEELKCDDGSLVKPDGNIGTPECIAPPTQPTQPPTTAKPSNKTTDINVTGLGNCDLSVNADTSLVKIDNLNANGFLKHDQPLVWSCKNGSTKASSEQLKCYDGSLVKPDGNIGSPECIATPTQSPTTAKHSNKTTDKNITGPDDKQEGVQPGVIGAIIAVLVALVVGIAGTLIAKKKKWLCFNKNPSSNMNANETDIITEKADTVHCTNKKPDPNEKHPLVETEKVDLGRDEPEKTPLMPFTNGQTDVEKADIAIFKESAEENKL